MATREVHRLSGVVCVASFGVARFSARKDGASVDSVVVQRAVSHPWLSRDMPFSLLRWTHLCLSNVQSSRLEVNPQGWGWTCERRLPTHFIRRSTDRHCSTRLTPTRAKSWEAACPTSEPGSGDQITVAFQCLGSPFALIPKSGVRDCWEQGFETSVESGRSPAPPSAGRASIAIEPRRSIPPTHPASPYFTRPATYLARGHQPVRRALVPRS